jgi:hypothetical protein
MNANEMVVVARIADHYESAGVNDPLETASHDLNRFRALAPRTWACLWNSAKSAREIGDRFFEIVTDWKRSGVSFSAFCRDLEDSPCVDETALEEKRMTTPVSKPGKHGTLYLHLLRYTDASDPSSPVFETRIWAYNSDHAIDKFFDSEDSDGWTVLSWERAQDEAQHRAKRHAMGEAVPGRHGALLRRLR